MYLFALLAAVAGLGDDDYDVREAGQKLATRVVRNHPRETHPVVCWVAGRSTSAEVRSRAGRLTGYWPALRAKQYRPGGVPVWPDIDRLSCDSPHRSDICAWKAAADNHPGPWAKPLWYPYYHRDRRAFELMIRALLLAGDLDECQADALVWTTWQNERAVFATCPQVSRQHDAWERAGWTDGYPREGDGHDERRADDSSFDPGEVRRLRLRLWPVGTGVDIRGETDGTGRPSPGPGRGPEAGRVAVPLPVRPAGGGGGRVGGGCKR